MMQYLEMLYILQHLPQPNTFSNQFECKMCIYKDRFPSVDVSLHNKSPIQAPVKLKTSIYQCTHTHIKSSCNHSDARD